MKLFFLIYLVLLTFCVEEPAQAKNSDQVQVKICAVGDVGMGTEVQDKVAKAMAKENCDRLVLLGDIIYPKGIQSSKDPLLQNLFFQHYKGFRKVFIILGNHDFQGNVEAWKEIARENSKIVYPASYYEEKINDVCLFYLDTNFSNQFSKIVGESLWLMKARPDCKFKIAFSHHPYLSPGPKHGNAVGFTKFFFDTFVIGKFDYLISGHEHVLVDAGVAEGTRQIISGAGGESAKGYQAGYLVFNLETLSPEKSTYQLIAVP